MKRGKKKTQKKAGDLRILDRLAGFFTRIPLPQTALHISAGYISGICLTSKEKQIKSHFILPLAEGIIEPSFYKPNIRESAVLDESLKEGMTKLRGCDNNLVFLLPEAAQKIFIFPVDSLPSSPSEREEFIRFRIKKQMPLLPEDSRLDYDWLRSNGVRKIVVSVARASVIREYEEFFHKHHMRIRVVGIPSLGSFNLIPQTLIRDFIFIDVEDHAFTLMAAIDSQLTLYRHKALAADDRNGNIDTIIQEVANTANFIEDNEKRNISALWVRLGLFDSSHVICTRLEEKLGILPQRIESIAGSSLADSENRLLSALIGYLQ